MSSLRPTGLLIPLLRVLLVLGAGGLTPAVQAESDPPSLNRLLNVPGWIDLNLNLQAQLTMAASLAVAWPSPPTSGKKATTGGPT